MADSTLLDAPTNAKKISGNSESDDAVNRKIYDLNDKLSNADDCFYWNRNLTELKSFVASCLNLDGKWSSPGGHVKLFKVQNLEIKWEGPNKKKLSLSGQSNEIELKLKRLLKSSVEDTFKMSDFGLRDQLLNAADPNIQNCLDDTAQVTTSSMASSSHNIPFENIVNKTISDIDPKFNKLEAALLDKFNAMSADLANLRDNVIINSADQYIRVIAEENEKLKLENSLLTDRLNTVSYVISDLNSKIKDLESEKASLVTTIKIINDQHQHIKVNLSPRPAIQPDAVSEQITKDANGYANTDNIVVDLSEASEDDNMPKNIKKDNKKNNRKNKGTATAKHNKNPSNLTIQLQNYQQQSNGMHNEISNANQPKSTKQVNTDQHHNSKSRNHKAKTTVIVGDSMIKNLQGWRLSNADNHVVVKSFSGATTSDMEDYLKPIIRREPEEIILHVGTNDLKLTSGELVADGVINLAIQIRENSPSTKVTISSILPRTDKPGLSEKISLTNKRIKSFCEQNNLDHLEHRAIDLTCLNSRGLHLNRKGTSVLATSITNYIMSN